MVVTEVAIADAISLLTSLGYQIKPGRVLADEMAADYRAGMSLRQIGAKYDVHRDTVRRWLLADGVTMRNRNRLSPDELAKLRRAVGLEETA